MVCAVAQRVDIARKLFQEPVAGRQSPTERLHEAFEAFRSFRARRGLRAFGQWRRDSEPKADEQRDGLAQDGDILVEPIDLAAELVHAACEHGLEPFGGVGREEGRDGCFDHRGFGDIAPERQRLDLLQ